ncbi:MAG: hypothetical protein GY811_22985 [Myxococcales bacterium]|nr:hypothetical protein [Myxococcales bacterium]
MIHFARVLVVSLLLIFGGQASAQGVAAEEGACSTRAAKLLRADAKRATQWNWGWGLVYAGAAAGQFGVSLVIDNDDRKVSLWTGATKATLGVFKQILFPKRISAPGPGCGDVAKKVRKAREVERRGHNWFAHSTVVAANVAGFAVVAGLTENYVLATSGTVIGVLAGELAIYTSPNGLRAAGVNLDSVRVLPQVGTGYSGLSLYGSF